MGKPKLVPDGRSIPNECRGSCFKSSWQPMTALISDREEVVGVDNTAAINVVQEVAPIDSLPTVCLDLVLIGSSNPPVTIHIAIQDTDRDRGTGQDVALVVVHAVQGDYDILLITGSGALHDDVVGIAAVNRRAGDCAAAARRTIN